MELKNILATICAALALYLTYSLLRIIHRAVAPRLAARNWFGTPPPTPKPSPSPYIKSPKPGTRRKHHRSHRSTNPSPSTPGLHIRHSPAPASATPTHGILTPEKGSFDYSVARSRRAGLSVGFSEYVSIDADPALDKYPMKAPAVIRKAALPVAIADELMRGVCARVWRRAEKRLKGRRPVTRGWAPVGRNGRRIVIAEEAVGGEGGVWGLWEGVVGMWREDVDWEYQLELWTAVIVVSAVLKVVGEVVEGLGWFAMGVGAMFVVAAAVGVELRIVGRKEW